MSPEIQNRIYNNISPEPMSGCWLWTSNISKAGYARLSVNNRRQYVHRLSYEEFVGPIPDGLQIDHLCRVRCCVNPDHLEPVTHLENIRRGVWIDACRERSKRIYDEMTHCINGHPLNEENTRYQPDKRRKGGIKRYCIACRRLYRCQSKR